MAEVRTLGPAMAQVIEELELRQPVVVTTTELGGILHARGIKTSPREVAKRLRDRGWLLATSRPGVYEFAPGAHAGPYGHGDPFVTLRATLASRAAAEQEAVQGPSVAACLHSALWLQGLAERAPNIHEVAFGGPGRPPLALRRDYRVLHFGASLAVDDKDGIPFHRPASILTHAATRPADVRSWLVLEEALPELVERSTSQDLAIELREATAATKARLGYLLEGQACEHLKLDELGVKPAAYTTRFGPRTGQATTYDSRWDLVDTVFRVGSGSRASARHGG